MKAQDNKIRIHHPAPISEELKNEFAGVISEVTGGEFFEVLNNLSNDPQDSQILILEDDSRKLAVTLERELMKVDDAIIFMGEPNWETLENQI